VDSSQVCVLGALICNGMGISLLFSVPYVLLKKIFHELLLN
jgi:hypothetical protein